MSVCSTRNGFVKRTSVSDFGGYLKEIVIPNVSMLSVAIVLCHFLRIWLSLGQLQMVWYVKVDWSYGKTEFSVYRR